MKKTILSFCNFFAIMFFVIIVTYISAFTDIPTKTGNFIREKIEEFENDYEAYSHEFYINNLGINMNTYYYEKLTDGQKLIYAAIANGVKNFQYEFVVRDYIAGDKENFASEAAVAIEAFINDHPEVFYLKSNYSTYVLPTFKGNYGYIKLNYTEESVDEINAKLSLMEEKVEEYVRNNSLDCIEKFEQELVLHDSLAYAVTYYKGEDIPRKYHTIEGTLIEDTGVCDGFSKTYQILLDQFGIDSIIVLGTLDGGPHAWNLVNLEDGWYHVDITSSRSIYDETNIVNHGYFNINDERLTKFSVMDTPELVPDANSAKYSYYNYKDLNVNENELQNGLQSVYNRFTDNKHIEFYLEGDVSNNISKILTTLKGIDSSFVKDSKMYYYNIENALVIEKN